MTSAPHLEGLDDVRRLARCAAYAQARSIAARLPAAAGRTLLLAYCAHRQRRPAQVLCDINEGRAARVLTDVGDAAVASALELVAAVALRDDDIARRAQAALSKLRPALRAQAEQVAYYRALANWMRGDLEASSADLRGIASNDASMRARVMVLESWLDASRNRYDLQAQKLVDAVLFLERHAPDDVGSLANAIHSLATLQRETYVPAVRPLLERVITTLPWTDDLRTERVQSLRALAWGYALDGVYVRAYRTLGEAKAAAHTPHQRMLAHLDHAQVAMWAGESLSLRAELEQADAAANQIQWSTVGGEEVFALVVAATIHAAVDPRRAGEYYRQAADLRESVGPGWGLAHGSRLDAYFAEAEAVVFAGDRERGLRAASIAVEFFTTIGYDWRAARAALAAFRISGDTAWLDTGRRIIAAYPHSWIARELSALGTPTREPIDLTVLTPRQHEVFDRLMEGRSNATIAAELEISTDTVKYHIKELYRQLRVTSRAELFSKARQAA